jgi:hypothetical protein
MSALHDMAWHGIIGVWSVCRNFHPHVYQQTPMLIPYIIFFLVTPDARRSDIGKNGVTSFLWSWTRPTNMHMT